MSQESTVFDEERYRANDGKVLLFSLLRFLTKYSPQNRDNRADLNLHLLFQIPKLKAMYAVLESVIPGFIMALPIHFRGDWKNQEVFWVIECDPCDLGDFQAEHALIKFIESKEGQNVQIQIQHFNTGWSGNHFDLDIRRLTVLISKIIDPVEFNEAVSVFLKSIDKVIENVSFSPYEWFKMFRF